MSVDVNSTDGRERIFVLDYVSLIWGIPIASKLRQTSLSFVPGVVCLTTIACHFMLLLSQRCLLPWNPLYPLHWRQKFPMTMLYTMVTVFNERQLHIISPRRQSTGHQIREYCRKKSLEHEERLVELQRTELSPPCLHFIIPPDADPNGRILYYAHGGGYQYPMRASGCMPLVLHLAAACKAAKLVLLEYSLTPSTQYPGQLMQAVEGLRYLLDQGNHPSDLIVGGDSAGGHLIAGLLLHIKQPAPTLFPLHLDGKQLHAAVLLSPWLAMTGGSDVGPGSQTTDFLQTKHIDKFTKLLNPTLDHVWANPIHAPNASVVWKGVVGHTDQSVVHRLLVTAGDAEILHNSCKTFMEDFIGNFLAIHCNDARSTDDIQKATAAFAVGSHEVHVQPALDASQQYYSGDTMKALVAFLRLL